MTGPDDAEDTDSDTDTGAATGTDPPAGRRRGLLAGRKRRRR